MRGPIRIAMIMGKMIGGGVEAVVMNYYRHIDKTKYQFDFIVDSDSTLVPEKEITRLGGKIYRISPYQKVKQYGKDLEYLFKKNNYQIVHSHINTLSVFPLRIAKKCQIPVRIAHSHSTSAKAEYKKNLVKYFLRNFSKVYATDYMAPTNHAGEWLFGKYVFQNKGYILKNAIDINGFKFEKITREIKRKELQLADDAIVIGNIGRMVWQKNQLFLVDIFQKLAIQDKRYHLVLIGTGELKEKLKEKIQAYSLEKRVTLIDHSCQISDYYHAMDLFLFPSNYEGLGMVAIEAQISGLPTVMSNQVPYDTAISQDSYYLELKNDSNYWADFINKITLHSVSERESYRTQAIVRGYDITQEVKKLEMKYNSLLSEGNFSALKLV